MVSLSLSRFSSLVPVASRSFPTFVRERSVALRALRVRRFPSRGIYSISALFRVGAKSGRATKGEEKEAAMSISEKKPMIERLTIWSSFGRNGCASLLFPEIGINTHACDTRASAQLPLLRIPKRTIATKANDKNRVAIDRGREKKKNIWVVEL